MKKLIAFLTITMFGLFQTDVFSAFYNSEESKQGWWWYKEEKKKEEKNKKEVKKETQELQEKEITKKEEKEWKPTKPLEEYTYEELLKMPAEDFRKLFNYYRDLAVSDPTNEKNIYYFYNLVDVARKKSLIFMAQAMQVLNKYPELNVLKDVATVNPAIKNTFELQREEERNVLKKIGEDFGLVVFVKEGCSYCDIQLSIMKYFISEGVPVKIVDVSRDPSAISKFAIETVPTIILVSRKTGNYLPIAVGVVSAAELYKRITTYSGYLAGEKEVGQIYLYDFQKGTSLDPYTPPPLFKKKKTP
jgi:conjugal transfer pilus assembly protein TraF